MIDLIEVQQNLIRHLEETIELIKKAEISNEVKYIEVTSEQVKNEQFISQLVSQLPMSGSYIYWFEVNDPNELVKQFNAKGKSIDYKIARDNKGTDSKCVYVGSCTKTKLSNRFKQHCGWGPRQTYSLQLKQWLTGPSLTFTFSYVEIANAEVAAQIEDQLHRDMKPLFGKPITRLVPHHEVRVSIH